MTKIAIVDGVEYQLDPTTTECTKCVAFGYDRELCAALPDDCLSGAGIWFLKREDNNERTLPSITGTRQDRANQLSTSFDTRT